MTQLLPKEVRPVIGVEISQHHTIIVPRSENPLTYPEASHPPTRGTPRKYQNVGRQTKQKSENITPTLQEIKETLRNISNEEALVGADLNAHIESSHLHLLNTPDSEPTFRHGNSIGRSDPTMTRGASLADQCTWVFLEEENHSDHQYLEIHLQTNNATYTYLRFKAAFGGESRFINISDLMLTSFILQ
ncbi:hypothetical protein AVEN_59229-1 [Araneus ventricosus]|uniref:Endonuclease/exonuclease/phosphatase domain-containing protein n=1 Tax=Araneus ventricosus TaxID=182803 RepID=A0A4Y2CYR4_ARAVE|nr:hypothetical protein AVEN_59229-1 [Araneus ventricosus]